MGTFNAIISFPQNKEPKRFMECEYCEECCFKTCAEPARLQNERKRCPQWDKNNKEEHIREHPGD